MATVSTSPVVREVVEEEKPIVEIDTPISKRKNRKTNQVETTATVTPSPSVKKSRPRRFVWTLNKVIILFGLFTLITISLIIYMFKQIA
jgi:hypothetical protein